MNNKLPTHIVKPRFLSEIPRSEYMSAPSLKGSDEQSRRSFISMLRKGPDKAQVSRNKTPNAITFNCAAWLNCNKALDQTASLILHYKDTCEEYCVLVDEANPNGGHSLMLSGCVTIYPEGPIEFIRASCSGIPETHHVHVEEMHIKGDICNKEGLKLVANG